MQSLSFFAHQYLDSPAKAFLFSLASSSSYFHFSRCESATRCDEDEARRDANVHETEAEHDEYEGEKMEAMESCLNLLIKSTLDIVWWKGKLFLSFKTIFRDSF